MRQYWAMSAIELTLNIYPYQMPISLLILPHDLENYYKDGKTQYKYCLPPALFCELRQRDFVDSSQCPHYTQHPPLLLHVLFYSIISFISFNDWVLWSKNYAPFVFVSLNLAFWAEFYPNPQYLQM